MSVSQIADRSRLALIEQLEQQGITHPDVLQAVYQVPRERFVDSAFNYRAYDNTALPIGHSQTISQPYTVALMTELLLAEGPLDKVLEIGTGSGYQTAVLTQLVERVFTVERIQPLQEQAKQRLAQLQQTNVVFRWGDGWQGWPAFAPFNGILVTAAADQLPLKLIEQLAVGGRLVIPIGSGQAQKLYLIRRQSHGYTQQAITPVYFVPMLSGIEH